MNFCRKRSMLPSRFRENVRKPLWRIKRNTATSILEEGNLKPTYQFWHLKPIKIPSLTKICWHCTTARRINPIYVDPLINLSWLTRSRAPRAARTETFASFLYSRPPRWNWKSNLKLHPYTFQLPLYFSFKRDYNDSLNFARGTAGITGESRAGFRRFYTEFRVKFPKIISRLRWKVGNEKRCIQGENHRRP